MVDLRIFKEFIQKHSAAGSRSSALAPLSWMAVLLIIALIICIQFKAISWIITILVIGVCLNFILFLSAYIYFMLTDKDALRSEKFTIQKMAIEKGLIGDNLQGIISLQNSNKSLPPPSEENSSKS